MAEIYEFRRLREIFDGDGSEIRQQFIFAGLLLTIFERFKEYVIDHVDWYLHDLSAPIEIRDDYPKYKRGDEFKKLVKEKGVHAPGQHANKEFRAALHWFCDLGAITEDEFNDVERLYALRNDIAHELFQVISDDRKNPIKLDDVLTTFSVYLKIVRWWVKEVEATTDPDFEQEKYDNTNWDEVESFDTIWLREIIRKSLLGDMDWQEIEKLAHANQAASVADKQAVGAEIGDAAKPKS
jgi:hypothetical protein